MSARNIIIAVIAIAAASIVSAGCYTIIKHPEIQSTQTSVDTDSYTHTSQDRDCMRCHQDFSSYPYGYYYSDYYPDYYWTYPSWGSYYAYPWWWDHYWYKDNYDFEPVEGTTGERPDRRRQGMTPPYTRGADPTPPPALTPPSFPGGTIGGSSGGTTTGGGTGTTDDGNKPKEEKKEQKPPKRRGGTKKGDG